MSKLLTQITAQKEPVALLAFVYHNRFLKWVNNKETFTDTLAGASYDVYSYFDPASDNDDVLYNVLETETSGKFTEDQQQQIMFYSQLIREDYYEGKAQKFKQSNNDVHITNVTDYTVRNLTPAFLKHCEENRKIFLALLNGAYYDNFVS